MRAKSIEPILAVPDIQATLDYYDSVLGFIGGWSWGDPAVHGGIRSGPISLQFTKDADLAERARGSWVALFVEATDACFALHVANGAEVVSPIENKPWGLREYTVRDLNGYLLRFGGSQTQDEPSLPVPPGVTIEVRVPTPEEFAAINPEHDPGDRLARSHAGAVARLHGRPVAMARVMLDGPGWYSVWDVEVVPDLRGRHIGHLLMERLLEALRQESPGAFVYLFTMKPGFYEKLGFTEGTNSVIRL